MTSVNIQTAIKIRPFIEREKRDKLEASWLVKNNSIVQIDSAQNFIGDPYSFDHIFDATQTNKHVYDAVVKPLVMSCFEGINSTIFAYGQTSSGKTHTMLGDKKTPGIISLAIQDIFSYIKNSSDSTKFLLRCSYLEIYNEKLNDLLDTNATDIKIREGLEGVCVVAKEEVVREPADLFCIMNKGLKTRKIGCTDMNERSSRSHTIFKLIIQSQDLQSEGSYVESALNLVDLAGSERVGQMNMEKERQVEGVSINKSLTTLGLVIRKLSENDSFINYRDSKLTRLLQHSLGGNSRTLIIANITTAALEETKSTLEFAQRAKYVKNQPIRNEKVTDKDQLKQYENLCSEYKDQIEKLRLEKEEKEKTIDALVGKITSIELFSAKPSIDMKTKPLNRRHTFAFKPGKQLYDIKEPGDCEQIFKQISPAKSEFFFPVTHDAEDKENIISEECCFSSPFNLERESLPKTLMLEEGCFSPPFKLDRASLPNTPNFEDCCFSPQLKFARASLPKTPYSTLKHEKHLIEESYRSLKSFTSHEKQYGNELDDLKELVDKLRQENFELRADLNNSEVYIKKSEDIQDIYEELLLLKSILEVKPPKDSRRNSLNTIFEEEIDLFDGDIDSSITSSPIKLDTSEKSTNKMCAAIIEENKNLKWQLNENERIIRGLKNDFNSEKNNIDTAFWKLSKSNENLLKEIDNIKCENEQLKLRIAQDKDIKECELEIFNRKIKKLTDYKEELHKKISELQTSEESSGDLTKINREEWQKFQKEHEELKLINEMGVVKIKELEEEICMLKKENIQKDKHILNKELEVDELKKYKEFVSEEKNSLTDQIRQLKSELDDVMFSLSGEQKELEKVSQELEEKCQKNMSWEQQMEMYINEYNKLSDELLKKDELLQITMEDAKHNKEIELKLKSTKEQFEEVSLELQDKCKELEQKLQQIEALEKLVFEQEQLQAQNQEHVKKLDGLFNDICKKDKTIEMLQKTVSEQEQLKAQNQEYIMKLNELSNLIREKDVTIETLQHTITELNAQNQEHLIKLNELSDDIFQKVVTIESLQKSVEDLKQDKEIKNYQVEITTVTKQLEEKSENIEVLERKISEMKAQNQNALLKKEETIEILQKEIEDMKQTIEEANKNKEEVYKLFKDLSNKEEKIESLQKEMENMKQNMNEVKLLNSKLLDYENQLIEKNKLFELVSLESKKWEALHEEDVSNVEGLSGKLLEKSQMVEKLQKELQTIKGKYHLELTIQNQLKHYKEYEVCDSMIRNTFESTDKDTTQIESNLSELEELESLKKNNTEKLIQFEKVANENADLKTQISKMKENLSEVECQNQEHLMKLDEILKDICKKDETIETLQKQRTQNEVDLKLELQTLNEKFEGLSKELLVKSERIQEKSQLLAQLKSQNLKQVNNLLKDLSNKEETIESLQNEMDNMKQNMNDVKLLNSKLLDYENQLIEKNKLFEHVSLESKKWEALHKEDASNVEGLSKKLLEKSQMVDKLQKELQTLEEKYHLELTTIQNQLKHYKENEVYDSKIKNTTFESTEQDKTTRIELNLAKLEELEALKKNHTEKMIQFEKVANENADLKTQISKMNENVAELKRQNQEHLMKLDEILKDICKKDETIETLQKQRTQNEVDLKLELKTMNEKFEGLSKELLVKSERIQEKSQLLAQLKAQNLKQVNKLLKDLSNKEETIESLQNEMANMKQNMNEVKLLRSKLLDYENQLIEKNKLFELVSLESKKWEALHKEDASNVEGLSKKLLEKSQMVDKLQKELQTLKEKYHLELTTIQNQLKHYKENEVYNSKIRNTSFESTEKDKTTQVELNLSKLEDLDSLKKNHTEKLIEFEKVANENADLKTQISKMKENLSEVKCQNQEHIMKLDEILKDICKKDEIIETLQKQRTQNEVDLKLELKTLNEKFEGLSKEVLVKSERIQEKSQLLAQLKAQNLKQVNKLLKDLSNKEETIESLQNEMANMKQNMNEVKLLKSKLLDYENQLIEKNKLFELVSLESKKWEALHKEDASNVEGLSKKLLEKSQMVDKLQKELQTLEEKYHLELTTIQNQLKHEKENEVYNSKIRNTSFESTEKDKTTQIELNLSKLEEFEALKKNHTEKLIQFEKVANENADLKTQISKMKENVSELTRQNQEHLIKLNELSEDICNKDETIETLQKQRTQNEVDLKLELKTMNEKFEGLSRELIAKTERLQEKSQFLAQLKAQNLKQVNKLLKDLSNKEETIVSLQKKLENIKQNTNEVKLLNNKLLDYENQLIEKNKLFELVSLESEKWEALHKEEANNVEGLSKKLCEKSQMVEKLQTELHTLKEKYHLELITTQNQLKHYEENYVDNSKSRNTTSEFKEKDKTKQIDLNLSKLEEFKVLKRSYTDKLAQFEKVTNENADLKKQLSKMKENLLNKSLEIEKLIEQLNKISQNDTNINPYQIFGNDSSRDSTSQLEEIKRIKKHLNEKFYEITKLNEDKRKLHQDLVEEMSSNRKLEQQLSALQKKMKHEPETPPEKPSRHSSDGRVSPKELRKIKRHSLLEQRRGISSESAMLDNDSSDSECTNCTSIKEKWAEMLIEIDRLKEDNKYLDKENEDMLKEVDQMKGEILNSMITQDQTETLTGPLQFRLEVAPPHQKADKGTQATCDYHHKYSVLKRVAELRRKEGNYLRKKLNLPADCPVLPTDLDCHQSATPTM